MIVRSQKLTENLSETLSLVDYNYARPVVLNLRISHGIARNSKMSRDEIS